MFIQPRKILSAGLLVMTALLVALSTRAESQAELAQQVREAETAFADTMARRDLAAFRTFLADEAVFFGKDGAVHGREAVVTDWKPFFESPTAPFSWRPATVEVLASGTLAISSGPISDPQGRQVGTFNSIWRRAADGRWLVVFDKGCDACACKPAP